MDFNYMNLPLQIRPSFAGPLEKNVQFESMEDANSWLSSNLGYDGALVRIKDTSGKYVVYIVQNGVFKKQSGVEVDGVTIVKDENTDVISVDLDNVVGENVVVRNTDQTIDSVKTFTKDLVLSGVDEPIEYPEYEDYNHETWSIPSGLTELPTTEYIPSGTYVLSSNRSTSIVIPSYSEVTLYIMDGVTVNSTTDGIWVKTRGKLTVYSKGTVQCSANGSQKCSVMNEGECYLHGGIYFASGNKAFYTITNQGTLMEMTDVTVYNETTNSSMIENGYYNGRYGTGRSFYREGEGSLSPRLVIYSGKFDSYNTTGTIKNDAGGYLEIHDGKFVNHNGACIIQSSGMLTDIRGGYFQGSNRYAMYSGSDVDTYYDNRDCVFNISGGYFHVGAYAFYVDSDKNHPIMPEISGGWFSTNIVYAAKGNGKLDDFITSSKSLVKDNTGYYVGVVSQLSSGTSINHDKGAITNTRDGLIITGIRDINEPSSVVSRKYVDNQLDNFPIDDIIITRNNRKELTINENADVKVNSIRAEYNYGVVTQTSIDAIRMYPVSTNVTAGNFRDGCYSEKLGIAVFSSLSNDGLYWTEDGTTFTRASSSNSNINVGNWETACWDGSRFIATGDKGLWSSTDGKNWILEKDTATDEITHYFDEETGKHWWNIGNFVTNNPDISTWDFTNRQVSGINTGAWINDLFVCYYSSTATSSVFTGGRGLYWTPDGVTYTQCTWNDGTPVTLAGGADGFKSGIVNSNSGKKWAVIAPGLDKALGVVYSFDGKVFKRATGANTGYGYETPCITNDGKVVVGSMFDSLKGLLVWSNIEGSATAAKLDGAAFNVGWWYEPIYIPVINKYYSCSYKDRHTTGLIISDDCINWSTTNLQGSFYPPTDIGVGVVIAPYDNTGFKFIRYVCDVATRDYVNENKANISSESRRLIGALSELNQDSSNYKVISTLNNITRILRSLYLNEKIETITEFTEEMINKVASVDTSVTMDDIENISDALIACDVFKDLLDANFPFDASIVSVISNMVNLDPDELVTSDIITNINAVAKACQLIAGYLNNGTSSQKSLYSIFKWSATSKTKLIGFSDPYISEDESSMDEVIPKLNALNVLLKEGVK